MNQTTFIEKGMKNIQRHKRKRTSPPIPQLTKGDQLIYLMQKVDLDGSGSSVISESDFRGINQSVQTSIQC